MDLADELNRKHVALGRGVRSIVDVALG